CSYRPPQAKNSCGSVTIDAILNKTWIEDGRELHDYTIKINSGAGRMRKLFVLEPNAEVVSARNLTEISFNEYQTPEWMTLEDGESCEDLGYVSVGASTPWLLSCSAGSYWMSRVASPWEPEKVNPYTAKSKH
ncbi:hypothetical protein PENTCL1PPCAC_21413, partial [Pristionchus entomophagus]